MEEMKQMEELKKKDEKDEPLAFKIIRYTHRNSDSQYSSIDLDISNSTKVVGSSKQFFENDVVLLWAFPNEVEIIQILSKTNKNPWKMKWKYRYNFKLLSNPVYVDRKSILFKKLYGSYHDSAESRRNRRDASKLIYKENKK